MVYNSYHWLPWASWLLVLVALKFSKRWSKHSVHLNVVTEAMMTYHSDTALNNFIT